jgi:hypothetical protein
MRLQPPPIAPAPTRARRPRTAASGAAAPLAALCSLLAAAALPRAALAQGLLVDGADAAAHTPLAASKTFARLSEVFNASRAWKAAFKASPRAACRAGGGSLCAAAGGEDERAYAQLLMATSPLAYSSADPASTGGLNLVPPASDQHPCAACTGFAAAGAAHAAMAAALRVPAAKIEPLSVQDLLYCSAGGPATCDAGWTLPDALQQLAQRRLAPASCMPYKPPRLGAGAGELPTCGRECAAGAPQPPVRYHPVASQVGGARAGRGAAAGRV